LGVFSSDANKVTRPRKQNERPMPGYLRPMAVSYLQGQTTARAGQARPIQFIVLSKALPI